MNHPNNPISIINQVDLKKKKLEAEIHQLERQLKKQEKLQHLGQAQKINKTNRKNMHSPTSGRLHSPGIASRSPRSQVSNQAYQKKQVKPAISENWKKLFRIDPIVFEPEQTVKKGTKSEEMEYWVDPVPVEHEPRISMHIMEGYWEEAQDLKPYRLAK